MSTHAGTSCYNTKNESDIAIVECEARVLVSSPPLKPLVLHSIAGLLVLARETLQKVITYII